MDAEQHTARRVAPQQMGAAGRVPEQGGPPGTCVPADRLTRQVVAIDAWIAVRRQREQALQAPSMPRDERLDLARQVEALRRTHDAIQGRCALGLSEALRLSGPTAVIAHRHTWFLDKLSSSLSRHGVTVLVRTDNAAEALGAVVAEQPDIVLLGDRLAMMSVSALVTDVRVFAPGALLAVTASDPRAAAAFDARADAVYLSQDSPSEVADGLRALYSGAA